jgi:serine/threonine protein kinase
MFQSGEQVDRYTIQHLLGRGGQGEVYLAHDPNLDIPVALKFLAGGEAEVDIDRVRREATTLARMNNPNIVRIFDFNPTYPYLVLEYCGGGDLTRELCRRQQMPLGRIVAIARQICRALSEAHDRSILHRDLKPGNVLFDDRGIAKVTDFGLAKDLGEQSMGLTKTQGVVGTAWYMSPEQCQGERVDHRTDLWAAGVVLYEMLTWVRPFSGPNFVKTSLRIIMEPPEEPPYAVPEPIWGVVRKALEKKPDDRFASARDMMAALDEALQAVSDGEGLLLPPASAITEESRLAARIAELVESGDMDAARTQLHELRSLAQDSALRSFWERRIRESSGVIPAAATPTPTPRVGRDSEVQRVLDLVASGQGGEARRKMGEIIARDPDSPAAQELMDAVPRELKRVSDSLEAAQKEADRASSSGNHRRAVEVWKELAARYPAHPEIVAGHAAALEALAAAEELQARAEAEGEARRLADGGDLAGAVAIWDRYLSEHASDGAAREERDRVQERLRLIHRAEELAARRREAERLEGAGDLRGALAAWDLVAAEDPDAADAAGRARHLRERIRSEEMQARVDETGTIADRLRGAGDLRGAIGAWRTLQGAYPDHPGIAERIQEIEVELAARERRALQQAVAERAGRAQARLGAGRYAGLPGATARLEAALQAAGTATSPADLATAREALATALDTAEDELSGALEAGRAGLVRAVEDASAMALAAEARGGDAGARLREALDLGVAALAEVFPPEASGDPLASRADADGLITEASAGLEAEQAGEIRSARERATALLEAAATALAALEEELGDAPETIGIDAGESAARLAALREAGEAAREPGRLATLAMDASALHAELEAARLDAARRGREELRRAVQEGRMLQLSAPAADLAERLRKGARSLDDDRDGARGRAGERFRLAREIGTLVAKGREDLQRRQAAAAERWARARAAKGQGSSDEAAALERRGEAALAASRPEELEVCAVLLEGLAGRDRLAATWEGIEGTVGLLEGPAGADGAPRGLPPRADAELLGRLRAALARGDDGAVAKLVPELRARRADGGEELAAEAAPIPAVGARARRLNERVNGEALRRFDELAASLERAGAAGKRREAAQLAEEARRAHRSLVPPEPAWRIPAAAAAVALVVLASAWAYWTGGAATGGLVPVKVLAPSGSTAVAAVLRDGEPQAGLELQVPVEGTTWTLPAGHYEVRSAGGSLTTFDVPRDRWVLIPEGETDYEQDILAALQGE